MINNLVKYLTELNIIPNIKSIWVFKQHIFPVSWGLETLLHGLLWFLKKDHLL